MPRLLRLLDPRNLRQRRLLGGLLVAGGLMMVGAGMWRGYETTTFLASTARAEGTVIELRRERGVRGIRKDHAIVRFAVPETGRIVVVRSKVGMWPSPFDVGERVEVAYDRRDPARAEIDSFWTLWLPPVAFLGFGVACLVAGISSFKGAGPSKPS